MDLADHPLLNDPSLTALILHTAAEGPVDLDALLHRLDRILVAANEAPAAADDLRPHLQSLCADLAIAGLIVRTNGSFAITESGREAVVDHPEGLGRADLMAWPPYAEHVKRLASLSGAPAIGPHDGPKASAYLQGVAARIAGLAATDNPHPPDGADHGAWENGWHEASEG